MDATKTGRAGTGDIESKWAAFPSYMNRAENDPELQDEPEEELPETPEEPEDKGTLEEAAAEEAPAEDEAEGETDAESETSAEVEAPVSQVVKFKVRGAERALDLSNPEEAEELKRFLSKGANYELLTAEFDEKVHRTAQEEQGKYFRENGLVAPTPTGEWAPSPQGTAKWALKFFDAATLRKALDEVAPPAESVETDLSWVDDVLKDANPEDPADKVLLAMAKTIKAQDARLASLQQIAPRADQFAGEFDKMRRAAEQSAAQQAQSRYVEEQKAWLNAELEKVPITKGASDFERRAIWAVAVDKVRASNEPFTPERDRRFLAEAIKEFRDTKASSVTSQKATEKAVRTGARPSAKTPAPSAGTPSAPPPKKGTVPKRGTPEFEAFWRENYKNMVLSSD